MRIRWFVLFFVLLVVFPMQVALFSVGLAQSLINGADAVVDGPAITTSVGGGAHE